MLEGPINDAGPGAEEYLDWSCIQDGVYYVKISSVNANFGENVKYDLKVYRPIAPLFDGIIKGLIKDAFSDQAVPCSQITMIKTSAGATGACTSEGYLIFHPLGNFTVSIEAQGYTPKSQGITVVAGPNQLNFVLSDDSIKISDINNDQTVDLTDAVLALQILAGIEPAATVYKEADVNGDNRIGLEEVIYILQKVSGLR